MKAFEQKTVSNVAVQLNPEIYKRDFDHATKATVVVRTGSIRYLCDGQVPYSGFGMWAGDGDVIELESFNDIKFFTAIREESTDAVISVDFD